MKISSAFSDLCMLVKSAVDRNHGSGNPFYDTGLFLYPLKTGEPVVF